MSGFLLDTNVLSEFNRRGEPDRRVKDVLVQPFAQEVPGLNPGAPTNTRKDLASVLAAKKVFCDYNLSARSLTAMKVEPVRVGNSRGIRIPKPIIEQRGIQHAVGLRIENDHLVIARLPREGWEKAFRAAGSSVHDELLLDTPSNQFDREE